MKQRIQKAARRLGSGLAGAAAGMSLLLGGLFDTAEDLLTGQRFLVQGGQVELSLSPYEGLLLV